MRLLHDNTKALQRRGMSAMLRRLAQRSAAQANRRGHLAAFAVAGLLALGGAHAAFAGSGTWNGSADLTFDNSLNWSTSTTPGDTTAGVTTNTDVATFNSLAGGAITLGTARNLQSLSFGAATGGTNGTFTIGTTAGPGLILSSGGNIISNATAVSENVNAPLTLANDSFGNSGLYTIETDTPGSSRLLTIGGSVTGAATAGNTTTLTLTGTSGAINIFGGAISNGAGGGSLALVKNGTTTWQLNSGANTYSGGTTINTGTLRSTSTGASTTYLGTGAVTMAGTGGTLALGGSSAFFTNPLVVNGASNFLSTKSGTFAPTSLTGTGTLVLAANGTTNVVSYTDLKNYSGTLEVGANTTLRGVAGINYASLQNLNLVLDAGGFSTLNLGTNGAFTEQIGSLAGGGTIGGSVAGNGTFTYQIGSNNASTTFSGFIINGGTKSAITKVGTGTLTLNGTGNSYSGLTTINAGTLNINGTFALGGGNYSGTTFNGGTLQYTTGLTNTFGGGDISNIGGTPKPVTFLAGGATIDTNGNSVTYANTVGTSGAGSLTKTGAGTLTLTAASTYTGGTVVNGGTLALNSAGADGTGPLTVTSPGIVSVGANGALGGGAVTLTNGTLQNTLLTATTATNTQNSGNLTLGAANTVATLDFGALNTGALFSFTGLDASSVGGLSILDYTGTPDIGGGLDQLFFGTIQILTTAQLAQISFVTGTQTFAATQLASGEVVETLGVAAAPEPSQYAAFAIGLLGLGGLALKARRRTLAA